MGKKIDLYVVHGAENWSTEEEREHARESFDPEFIHIRNGLGQYVVAVVQHVHDQYEELDKTDEYYEDTINIVEEVLSGKPEDVIIVEEVNKRTVN